MLSGQIQIVTVVAIIFTCLLIGFLIGLISGSKANTSRPIGTFVINHTDPTKDLCTLQLDVDLDVIEASKQISFKVAIIDDQKEKSYETQT